jgi:hypothetical protein
MKNFAIAMNVVVLVAGIMIYTNHIHNTETQRLVTQIEIEKTVALVVLEP